MVELTIYSSGKVPLDCMFFALCLEVISSQKLIQFSHWGGFQVVKGKWLPR